MKSLPSAKSNGDLLFVQVGNDATRRDDVSNLDCGGLVAAQTFFVAKEA